MSILVNKFCNLLMRSGNKTLAYNLFCKTYVLFLQKIALHAKVTETLHQNHRIHNPSTNSIPIKYLHTPKDLWDKLDLEGKSSKQNQIQSYGSPGTNHNPEHIMQVLIENIRPCVEIRKVRVARATYQVPAQINKSKGQTLALRWIIEFANKRKQKDKISFTEALALELDLAYKKQGGPRQRRSEVHKLAEVNRSNMRYRWW